PSSILTVVDFPDPLGPSRPNTSPRCTSKSTLSTARALGRPQKSLNTLVNPRTAATTSGDCGLRIADCGLASVLIMTQQDLVFCGKAKRPPHNKWNMRGVRGFPA